MSIRKFPLTRNMTILNAHLLESTKVHHVYFYQITWVNAP